MKRATVTLDRAALFSALAALRAALIRGDTAAALRQLDSIYRLLPVAEAPRSNAR